MEDEIFNAGSVSLRRSGFTFKMLDIVMRLPPVYMMDTVLANNMGVTTDTVMTPVATSQGHTLNVTDHIANSTDLYQTFSTLYGGNPALLILPHIVRFLACLVLYMVSFFVFLLPTESLLVFYRYLVSVLVMPLSYYSHKIMVENIGNGSLLSASIDSQWPAGLLSLNINYNFISNVLLNHVVQCSLASVMVRLVKIHGHNSQWMKDYLVFSMISPCLVALLSLPSSIVLMSAFVSNLLPAMMVGISLGQQMHKMTHSLTVMYRTKRDCINNFGLNTFIESEWSRLRVPSVLRYFWLTRMLIIFAQHQRPLLPLNLDVMAVVGCVKDVLVQGSDTMVSVLGMTSVVSTVSHWLGVIFQLALAADTEEDKSVASVSAVLFFVLALQTGLTGMQPDKRFQQICKNLCLLVTAILHFVHSMVQPVLMSLSASRSSNKSSHIRALLICLFLLLAPSIMMTLLWKYFTVGTWLLAVTAFCIEVIIKVLVTITIYILFMWDSHCQDGLWESMDDWVYYIRASGNVVEFCFAVFLFFNGGWILLFESGGTIRACMMLIHAYFNIWCEARNGWSAFTKRRTAVAKINSLNDATEDEIEKHNDVCAICYQEMTVAKLTRCRHMFHSICLRKWLYMQDNCPMCHEKLYRTDATSQTEADILGNPPHQPAPQVAPEMEVGAFDNEENSSTDSSDSSNDDDED